MSYNAMVWLVVIMLLACVALDVVMVVLEKKIAKIRARLKGADDGLED